MAGKCSNPDCAAPDVPCHLTGGDYSICTNFSMGILPSKRPPLVKKTKIGKAFLPWDGRTLSPGNMTIITQRSNPIILGIVGKYSAGKTSYLSMLYTQLFRGRTLKDFNFAGSVTLLAWDELRYKLQVNKGKVEFPAPTPVSANNIYHLALRSTDGKLHDLLFSDSSGETFTDWAVNRNDNNAEIARWVYKNANGFMLFIDCEALVEQKNAAKQEMLLIARQMAHDLQNRPVVIIWSKSDKKGNILKPIKESLQAELENLFPNLQEIEISNFLDPGPDELVNKHNLQALDILLSDLCLKPESKLITDVVDSNDPFLNYGRQ